MAIDLTCRSCGEQFTAEKRHAGRSVDCAICGAENEVPYRSEASVAELRTSDIVALGNVAIGLTLILIGISILLVYVILLALASMLDSWELISALLSVNLLVSVGVPILNGIGGIFCLYVPERSRARGLITTSMIIAGVTFVIQMSILLGGRGPLGVPNPGGLSILLGLMVIVGWVTFVLFIARTARYVEDTKSAKKATSVLYLAGIIFVAYILLFALVLGVRGNRGDGLALVGLFFGVVVFVLGILAVVRYVGSIAGTRGSIKAAIHSARY